MDKSKFTTRVIHQQLKRLDLYRFFNESTRLFRKLARNRGVSVYLNISGELPSSVYADASLLKQLLILLVGDAIQFVKIGSVRINVSLANRDEGAIVVRFEVGNRGIGGDVTEFASNYTSFNHSINVLQKHYGSREARAEVAGSLLEAMNGQMYVDTSQQGNGLCRFDIPFQVVKPEGAETDQIIFCTDDIEIQDNVSAKMIQQGKTCNLIESLSELINYFAEPNRQEVMYAGVIIDAHALGLENIQIGQVLSSWLVYPIPLVVYSRQAEYEQLSRWHALGYCSVLGPATLANDIASLIKMIRSSQSEDQIYVEASARLQPILTGIRLLIAEDDPASGDVLKRMAQRIGCKATLVDNGIDALVKIEQGEFDIALLDFQMPGLDGPEVVRRYIASAAHPHIPLVILTADATAASRRRCADSGADLFLTKPILMQELSIVLKRALTGDSSQEQSDIPVIPNPANIIDRACLAGLTSLGGDSCEFITKLYRRFFQDAHKLCIEMEDALCVRDSDNFNNLLHRIKGSAASVGANQVLCAVSSLQVLEQRYQWTHHAEVMRILYMALENTYYVAKDVINDSDSSPNELID